MSDIDITLPSRVPEMSRYHTIATGLKPFALYILSPHPLDLPDLLKTTNSLCPRPDYVKAAPKTIFKNSLKEVVNYHLTLSQFDPRYFLAVTTEDWREKGILVVTLDDDDLDCEPDFFRVKAEDAGILLVNLQIGNTDWFEARENYSLPSPATAERDDKDDKDADTDETAIFPDGAPKKKPSPGFYIPVYAIPGINIDQLIQTIQPAADKQPATEYICRFEGYLPTSTVNQTEDQTQDPTQDPAQNPAHQAMTSHPQKCKLNPYLHKTMFLVADSQDYEEQGLLMCDVENGKGGQDGKVKVKRVKCDVHTLVPDFCGIARGERGWDD